MNRREALLTLASGSAAGALAAGAVVAAAPVKTAASPDAMVDILTRYREAEAEWTKINLGDDDEAAEALRLERVEPVRTMIVEDRPAVTTNEGARLALSTALTHGVFIDPFTHTLVREALRFLEERA